MKIIKKPILIFEERIHFCLGLLFCYAIFCWQFTSTIIGFSTLFLGVICLLFPFVQFFYLSMVTYRKPDFNLKPGGQIDTWEEMFLDFVFIVFLFSYFYSLKYFLSEKYYFMFSTGSLFLLFLSILFLGIMAYFKGEYEPESKVIRLMVFKDKIVFFKRYFITEFELKDVDKIEIADRFVEIQTSTGFLQEFDFANFDNFDMEILTNFCEKVNNQLLE